VRAQVTNPATATTYREGAVDKDDPAKPGERLKGHMPKFEGDLSADDIDLGPGGRVHEPVVFRSCILRPPWARWPGHEQNAHGRAQRIKTQGNHGGSPDGVTVTAAVAGAPITAVPIGRTLGHLWLSLGGNTARRTASAF